MRWRNEMHQLHKGQQLSLTVNEDDEVTDMKRIITMNGHAYYRALMDVRNCSKSLDLSNFIMFKRSPDTWERKAWKCVQHS